MLCVNYCRITSLIITVSWLFQIQVWYVRKGRSAAMDIAVGPTNYEDLLELIDVRKLTCFRCFFFLP